MNELPPLPAPELPDDVRERVLHRVLAGIDDAPMASRRRSTLLVAAAAAVVVAIVLTTVVAMAGTGGDVPVEPLPPVVADGGGDDPFTGIELPAPSGDPATDLALARCAAAVVRSGRAAEYPPTREWRATEHVGIEAVESTVEIDDLFACLVSPASVAVSGLSGTPVGEVQVVQMSAGLLVVLNPDRREFAIGPPDAMQESDERVLLVELYGGRAPDSLWLTVVGGYDGPVREPVQALMVVDRDVEHRTDTAEGRYLDECFDILPSRAEVDDRVWVPVGWHDVGGAAVPALVARIGDIAVGFCMTDAVYGRAFAEAPLQPVEPGARARPIVFHVGDAGAILLAVSPEVTRAEVAALAWPPQEDPAAPRPEPRAVAPCTVLDGLAMCTIDARVSDGYGVTRGQIAVTAFTADDPVGVEVYLN